MREQVKSEAIVLRRAEFSETSQILTLWTREAGKVKAVAKGARRPRAGGGAGLDLLDLCEVVLVCKPPPALSIVAQWQVLSRFAALRSDIRRLSVGLYAAELADAATEEGDSDSRLYDLLVRFLREIERGRRPYPLLFRFEMLLLSRAGIAPQAAGCTACGDTRAAAQAYSAQAGGLVCAHCRPRCTDAVALSAETIAALARLAQPAAPRGLRLSAAAATEVRDVLDRHIAFHLGHALKMRRHVAPEAVGAAGRGDEEKG